MERRTQQPDDTQQLGKDARRRLSSSTATGKTRSPPAAQNPTNLLVYLHPAEGLLVVCCRLAAEDLLLLLHPLSSN